MASDLPPGTAAVYPRGRLDALTDGIYAVAMTLLALDVRLPEDFRPETAAQLADGLHALWPKLLPYALSFLLLGMRWLAAVEVHSSAERVGGAYIRWWLPNLFFVTCVPFATMVVGRHASLAPAVWLYAGNTALLAITSYGQLRLLPGVHNAERLRGRQRLSLLLLAVALASIAWSLVSPSHALWAFSLYIAAPVLLRWRRWMVRA